MRVRRGMKVRVEKIQQWLVLLNDEDFLIYRPRRLVRRGTDPDNSYLEHRPELRQ
jgi:hypothetical protein